MDYDDDYGKELSPHLGVLWNVSPNDQLYGSIHRAHRAPGLSDRYVKVVFNGLLFEGNPDLTPETLTAYEIGYRSKIYDFLTFEFSGFYNQMKDTFDFMFDPDGVFRNRNVTEAQTYGMESTFTFHVNSKVSSVINYSFTDGTYEKFPQNPIVEKNQLAYLAKHKAGMGLFIAFPHGCQHSIICRYVDQRFGDAENSKMKKMNPYITTDLRSHIRIKKHVALLLNIDNIFDTAYEDFPDENQPGRLFLFGIKTTF